MDMMSSKLIPVIMGFLSTIIGVIFLLFTIGALDTYSRFYSNHCLIEEGKTSIILHGYEDPSEKGPGLLVPLVQTAGANTCSTGTPSGSGGTDSDLDDDGGITASDVLTLYSEDGDSYNFTIATEDTISGIAISGSEWRGPLEITKQLGGLSKTLVGFMPLLVLVGFLASVWGSIGVHMMDGNDGIGSLTTSLATKIGLLIVLYAVVQLAPTLVQEANSTLLGLGAYRITTSYEGLQDLLFGFMPVIITIGIMGFALYDTIKLGRRVRERFMG